MAPHSNSTVTSIIDIKATIMVDSKSRAQFSILERLVRSLVAEKLLIASACPDAGVILPIRCNLAGRVQLTGPIYVRVRQGNTTRRIVHPIDLLDELQGRGLLDRNFCWDRLREEIENSLECLSQVLDAESLRSQEIRGGFKKFCVDKPFSSLVQALNEAGYGKHAMVGFEQLVVDGHPLTPTAKVRTGMSSVDAARYGPEFGSQFKLRLVAVSRDSVEAEDGTANVPGMEVEPASDTGVDVFHQVLEECFPDTFARALQEISQMGKEPGDFALIPIHPHQLENAIPKLHADALKSRTVIPLQTFIPARPLMSYRTLSVKEPGASKSLHVKTALEVQLTGAIRGVSSASARNGPRMSRLLARIISGDLALQRTDASGRALFIPESGLAGISFKESRRTLAAILREDIENEMADDEVALPISALFARSPLTGNLIIAELIAELDVSPVAWLRAHAELYIPPLLLLLSRYGIALEPHPQNMVLILRNGWPHRFAVRDFGGARILPSRLAQQGFSIDLDANTGLVIQNTDASEAAASLRAKLFYPLFGNQFGEIISALAGQGDELEASLWNVVHDVVRRAADSIGSDEALDDANALLEGPWRRKCLVKMRLTGAVTDQLYVDGPNPLTRAPPTASVDFRNNSEHVMFDYLRREDPGLCSLWQRELASARNAIDVDYRLALEREGVQEDVKLIHGIIPDWENLRIELADSATNLALARAIVRQRSELLCERARASGEDLLTTLTHLHPPSDIPLELDSLDAEGHPSHPCRRTRLGFSPEHTSAFNHEMGNVVFARIFAAKRGLLAVSKPSISELLREHYPFIVDAVTESLRRRGCTLDEFDLVVTHPFQGSKTIPEIYEDELAAGTLISLPEATLACRPTSSTRTLVTVAPGVQGQRLAFKTAIEVQITSTIRTISHASVRNGPYITTLLTKLLSFEPRVSCINERAGAAFIDNTQSSTSSRQRGLSVIVRDDVTSYARPGEVIIGCTALTMKSPTTGKPLVVELVSALAGSGHRASAAATFIDAYADLLLSATLPLLWHHGIALEAHLQNTLLIVDKDRLPTRLLLRDFAGMRVHTGRLQESGEDLQSIPCLHAGTFTADEEEIQAKFAHSVIMTNLLPVVNALSSIAPAVQLWAVVRTCIGKIYSRFLTRMGFEHKAVAYANQHLDRLLSKPVIPQKAFVTMRLLTHDSGGKNYYTPQPNPLFCL
ncbi:hypothetical protein TWF696_004008 [Orbilia brochopaga]|uniref:Uncharacterized protein n=1 Tax=Orbilia brochopaga TaxID=3140254 RepID=A0AAV9V4W0_9PEZI